MKHYDCSPFARPASFAHLAMAAYTPLLAIETIPSPFCSRADILPLTMGRFAPEAAIRQSDGMAMSASHPILLQKSKVASARFSGETLKHEVIDDSDNLSRATEVAYEFCMRR